MLSLVLVLSFAFVSCGDSKKDCKEDCKKECCDSKDTEACAKDCKKECCSDKEAQACEPGCEKECCADKSDADEGVTEVEGDETAHTCAQSCQDDPHSCPSHVH